MKNASPKLAQIWLPRSAKARPAQADGLQSIGGGSLRINMLTW
jgi:hypothetical protein